jgi:hypothetical protein
MAAYYKPGVSKRLRAPDGGWFYNLNKEQQTYYREFTIPEIKCYFDNKRYRELQKINAAHHRASSSRSYEYATRRIKELRICPLQARGEVQSKM